MDNFNQFKTVLLLPFIIVFVSCSSDVSSVNTEQPIEATHELAKAGRKTFKLDQETAPESRQFQIFVRQDSTELLTFLNSYNNSIYFYDFETEEFLYNQTFEKEGANGAGGIFGYHIHSEDSVFIHNYSSSMLFLFDGGQNKINSYSLEPDVRYVPAAKVSTSSPITIVGDTAYMTGNIAGEYNDETAENRPVLIKLNLDTKAINYDIAYPKIFREANWGGGQYRWLSHYYNPVDSLLFFSFSVDHDLIFLDLKNDEIFNQYAGSNFIDEIPSISSFSALNSISKQKIYSHFIVNGSYQYVGYVPSDEFYFRTLFLPESSYDPKTFNGLEISVVLMNRAYEKIGEIVFPKRSYRPNSFLISSEGLYFQKFTDKEDVLIFDQFKLKEIE